MKIKDKIVFSVMLLFILKIAVAQTNDTLMQKLLLVKGAERISVLLKISENYRIHTI